MLIIHLWLAVKICKHVHMLCKLCSACDSQVAYTCHVAATPDWQGDIMLQPYLCVCLQCRLWLVAQVGCAAHHMLCGSIAKLSVALCFEAGCRWHDALNPRPCARLSCGLHFHSIANIWIQLAEVVANAPICRMGNRVDSWWHIWQDSLPKIQVVITCYCVCQR
jgi:hypothetical protein